MGVPTSRDVGTLFIIGGFAPPSPCGVFFMGVLAPCWGLMLVLWSGGVFVDEYRLYVDFAWFIRRYFVTL